MNRRTQWFYAAVLAVLFAFCMWLFGCHLHVHLDKHYHGSAKAAKTDAEAVLRSAFDDVPTTDEE
jgi:hypothetical protein